jgi:N-methylhydantoinase B
MHVDYAGSSPASSYGINVVLNYTEAYTTFGLKCTLAPEVPNNEGSFRPVTITAPPGCILNCLPPSPVAARHIVGQWLPNAVHGALFHAVPERVLAEGASGLWNTQFNGWRADGRRFSLLFFNCGGMGARATKDGLSSTAFPSGVQGTPAEIVEARAPLMMVKRELRPDSGGPGATRGGLGHWLVLKGLGSEEGGAGAGASSRLAGDEGGGGGASNRLGGAFRFSPFFDRTQYPARGYAGGGAGAPGEYYLDRGAGPPPPGARPNPKQTVWVEPGTEIVMGLPGGGGCGDPLTRDPWRVAADVRDGYVTAARAGEDYGVVLDEAGGVDLAQTAALRAARGGASPA